MADLSLNNFVWPSPWFCTAGQVCQTLPVHHRAHHGGDIRDRGWVVDTGWHERVEVQRVSHLWLVHQARECLTYGLCSPNLGILWAQKVQLRVTKIFQRILLAHKWIQMGGFLFCPHFVRSKIQGVIRYCEARRNLTRTVQYSATLFGELSSTKPSQ